MSGQSDTLARAKQGERDTICKMNSLVKNSSAELIPEQIAQLQEAFNLFDIDGGGTINCRVVRPPATCP